MDVDPADSRRWLFPDADDIPESHEEKFNLQVETGDGDAGAADENAFGFVVMSGPKEDLISIDKRDGSHWELLGCERHDGRQTVRAVCTDTSEGSNCGDIFLGRVAETVVEMPPHCGAGRYAVAVSMEPSANQTLTPDVVVKLGRRRTVAPRLYDFTFDYDFKPIQARDSSDVLLRIDYASEPGYWASVVNSRPDKRKRSLEEMHHEVRTRHGGSVSNVPVPFVP
jgi:chitinase